MRAALISILLVLPLAAQDAETLKHFQNLIRIDTLNPPGNETRAVDYIRKIFDAEGISYKIFAKDPGRANLVGRIKGNGSKRPIIVMGHTDTVQIQREKWKFDPLGATLQDGFIYGRGTVDDKDNLTAGLMLMLRLQREKTKLNRDVIFIAEAGEETGTTYGIEYLIDNAWPDIEAEFCLAEGGRVISKNGKVQYVEIAAAEKLPRGIKLIAHGVASHGSRPTKQNAVVKLAMAVSRFDSWQPPMRLNDITRAYFERLATISTPEEADRYNHIVDPRRAPAIERYFAEKEPKHNAVLRTTISPTILKAGFQVNVIPSEAEATLDVRALPDEDMPAFISMMKKVINDPNVDVVPTDRNRRPGTPPSSLNTDMFRAIERVQKQMFPTAITLPSMSTGATDMSFLRAKGVQCYGYGPVIEEIDGDTSGGAHGDNERIAETSLYKLVEYTWKIVNEVAASK